MKSRRLMSYFLIGTGVALLALALVAWVLQLDSACRADRIQNETGKLYYGGNVLDFLMSSAHAEETEDRQIQSDFAELYAANADVVGWLKAGENIDGPVVQRDNEYYLTHDFYGSADSNGTLFLNAVNSIEPRDDVLLIHGHNMRSGAMFGKLAYFREYDYLKQYPIIMFRTIYDAQEMYYTPVYAFDVSMQADNSEYFDITRVNFDDENESDAFCEYLSAMQKLSLWRAEADVTENDKLLMLVTCSYKQEDGRFVLVCRALRDDETVEGINAVYSDE